MPKKQRPEGNLTIVRKGLGLSQAEFAKRLGVSASMIKKLEEGKRPISQDLAARIFAETGVIFVTQPLTAEQFSYTKSDHDDWLKEVLFDQNSARAAARLVLRLVELMLVSAARPGIQKSYQVWHALIQAVERIKAEFGLEKHIDAELRDRYSTEIKPYTVRQLRDDSLLAAMVGFKDDPKLHDDESLTLTKTTGWLPVKELFSIAWQHRDFIREILKNPDRELNDDEIAKLENRVKELEAAMDNEVETFLRRVP
jgi:transcriptional regulator with XRE-family HTH domain